MNICNKDDNIHKSEALKLKDKRTLTLVKCQNWIADYYWLSINRIVSKFVAKLHKYILLFQDILTFLGLDYRDASPITLYLVVIGNNTPKIRWLGYFYLIKNCCYKVKSNMF